MFSISSSNHQGDPQIFRLKGALGKFLTIYRVVYGVYFMIYGLEIHDFVFVVVEGEVKKKWEKVGFELGLYLLR